MRTFLRNGAAFVLAAVALVGIPLDYQPGGAKYLAHVLVGAVLFGLLGAIGYSRWVRDVARASRVRLAAWIVVRYFLALEFVRYGMAKIVGMQFYPRFHFLDSRVADLTPMSLAWSFFGHSYAYQAISGAIEVLGAVLLCFRRTTTLGACVLFGVMSNVVLVNFFFDVSVKTFSSIYLTMIAYLLALEARRFWAFFVTDGPPPARAYLVEDRPRTRGVAFGHLAVVGLVVAVPTIDILREARSHRLFVAEPILGAWTVDQTEGLEGIAGAPESWSKIYFEKGDYGFVRSGSKRLRFTFTFEDMPHRLELWVGGRVELAGTFELVDRHARFSGVKDAHPFELRLTRDLPR